MKNLLRIFAIYVFLFWIPVSYAGTTYKEATYYNDTFIGEYTSNGDIFSQTGFTAALCDIPLGKNVFVSRALTGVLVRINDRPNCNRYQNIIDLSKQIFSLFAPLSTGRISSIAVNSLDTIDTRFFESLGIIFSTPPATTYFVNEGVEFAGRVLDGRKNIILFLQNQETEEEMTQLFPVDPSGTFRARILLPQQAGTYSFVLASGNSFQTEDIATLTLVGKNIITDVLPEKNMKIIPKVDTLAGVPSITLPEGIWGSLEMSQDTKIFRTSGSRFLFDGFTQYRTGRAQVKIDGYLIGSGGSLDRLARIGSIFSGTVLLDRTHEKIGQNLAKIRNYKTYTNVRFRVPSATKIRNSYFLTLPDGDVREFEFPVHFVGTGGYLLPGKIITLTLPTAEEGTYLIETVRADGIAYFNLPITRGFVWNILMPYTQEAGRFIRTSSLEVVPSLVNRINKLRASLGRNLLTIDSELSRLAQAKADDMVRRNYYGHQDPDGNYISTLAKNIGVTIEGEYRENIAFGMGEVGDVILQDGLEESGSHRFAMLVPQYTKIGIGYVRSGTKTYLVQVIAE